MSMMAGRWIEKVVRWILDDNETVLLDMMVERWKRRLQLGQKDFVIGIGSSSIFMSSSDGSDERRW